MDAWQGSRHHMDAWQGSRHHMNAWQGSREHAHMPQHNRGACKRSPRASPPARTRPPPGQSPVSRIVLDD